MCGCVIRTRLWRNTVRYVSRVAVLWTSAVAVVLGLSACSGDSKVATAVVTHVFGLPSGITKLSASATWAQDHQIYVTTYGSSSCPRLPTSVKAHGPHEVRIKIAEPDGNCTSDLGPTTSTVKLPAEIDDTAALTVSIDGTSTHLGPRAG